MQKFVAEFIGTLTLVLFGCGAAVLGGDNVGQLGIALAFGFAFALGFAYSKIHLPPQPFAPPAWAQSPTC